MRIPQWWIVLLLALLLVGAACTDEGDEEEENGDDSVKVQLQVDQDSVFGFVQNQVIGYAQFNDTGGIVGSRIKCEIVLENYQRFENKLLLGTLELINPDAIKDDEYIVEFEIDEKTSDFSFYIPQIKAVPIYLNFRLTLCYEEKNVDQDLDQFEASLVFEFNVNQGRPAT